MASTLEDIAELFATKTTNLKRCVEIRSAGSSSTCISVLKSVENELKEIEAALDSLQADVKKEKVLIEQGEVRTYTRFLEEVEEKAMKEAAVKFRERLEHTSSNLPPHLPGFEKKVQRPSKEKDEPLKESVQNPRKTKRVKDISTADNGSRFPKLAYLTVEEFEEIPKYIKGRISYDQVNNAIDEIHKVIIAKYKILRLPRSAMGEPVMKKYKAFKEAETPETEGEYFFVDDDLKTYSQLKMDSTGKAILIMLRHCGRLREVRSKKLLRYVLKL